MISFEITGIIPSKKNSKQIFRGKNGKTFITSSNKYKKWHAENCQELKRTIDTIEAKGLHIRALFTAGDKRKFDLDNKITSVLDLMVDAGIIEDDNYETVSKLELEYKGYQKGNHRCEIEIFF